MWWAKSLSLMMVTPCWNTQSKCTIKYTKIERPKNQCVLKIGSNRKFICVFFYLIRLLFNSKLWIHHFFSSIIESIFKPSFKSQLTSAKLLTLAKKKRFFWLLTAHLMEDPPTLSEEKLGEIFEKSVGTWYRSSSSQIWSYWFLRVQICWRLDLSRGRPCPYYTTASNVPAMTLWQPN